MQYDNLHLKRKDLLIKSGILPLLKYACGEHILPIPLLHHHDILIPSTMHSSGVSVMIHVRVISIKITEWDWVNAFSSTMAVRMSKVMAVMLLTKKVRTT